MIQWERLDHTIKLGQSAAHNWLNLALVCGGLLALLFLAGYREAIGRGRLQTEAAQAYGHRQFQSGPEDRPFEQSASYTRMHCVEDRPPDEDSAGGGRELDSGLV
jgi:hypothetical protein